MCLCWIIATSFITNLPTVVVEASRIDASQYLTPASVSLVSDTPGARHAIDLVSRQAPQVHVRNLGCGNPALADIALRGYGENGFGRTLVLVDGERLGSPDLNAPNLARISSFNRFEIIPGPQTVLYGDGASAGLVNVITEPQSYDTRSVAEFRGGSWGSVGASVGTRGGFADEGLRYWADTAWNRSDGYRSNSAFDIANVNAGLRKDWSNGSFWRFSGFYGFSEYELPGALTFDQWRSNPRQSNATDDTYRRQSFGFNTTLNARINDENDLRTTANFSNRRTDGFQRFAGGVPFSTSFDVRSLRILEEWINSADLGGFHNKFILGAQYGFDAHTQDMDRQALDVFAQDTLHLLDNLAIQLGGRYSRTWSFNRQARPTSKADHLGAYELALVWNPVEDAKIYAKVTRTYRNPFLDEIPYDPRTWSPQGLLDPERGWNAEVGFAWAPSDDLSFGGDAYCSRLEDEIFYDSRVGSNVNSSDETYRRGIDLHAAWERDRLAGLSAAFSYVKASFDDGGLVPLVPEVTLALSGKIWLWDACSLFGGYRFQSDMVSASDFDNEADAIGWYGLFYAGLAYEPDFAEWIRGFRLTLTVDNLLDERYCDYATYGANYYPAAGRSFLIALRYEF